MRGGVLTALIAIAVTCAAPLSAQSMKRVAELCSDPMTTGPQKLTLFEAEGWIRQDKSSLSAVTAIANAHIASFTAGMEDWNSRYAAIPQLAGNFTRMIDDGAISLWTRDAAYLAISIQQTETGGEHLACYFAGPEDPDTLEVMARYGTPETEPEQGLTIIRFDESAFVMNPERNYELFSVFSRHQAYPEFATPDGYRLERVEQAATE
ncbi:hypothetical protein OO012_15550 [Rhodobacteraceae bacterium KMM 6894]|nr:hypothetical protein [Rhodobacteraceae bacterium KMM 6894]